MNKTVIARMILFALTAAFLVTFYAKKNSDAVFVASYGQVACGNLTLSDLANNAYSGLMSKGYPKT